MKDFYGLIDYCVGVFDFGNIEFLIVIVVRSNIYYCKS